MSVITTDSSLILDNEVYLVDVEKIEPSPFQSRIFFDQAELKSLGAEIEKHGQLQPILLRPLKGKRGRYQIVFGERRWRAMQLIRRPKIRATVRELTDIESAEIGFSENLNRQNLTDYEEAVGVAKLFEVYDIPVTPENIRRVGSQLKKESGEERGETFVRNRLDLLGIDPELLEHAKRGRGRITALVEIGRVREEHNRAELLEMLEEGKGVRPIRECIARQKEKSKRAKEARRAPDAQTQQRITLQNTTQRSGSVSRGRVVTSAPAQEMERAADGTFDRLETMINHVLENQLSACSPKYKEKRAPSQFKRIRKALDELEAQNITLSV